MNRLVVNPTKMTFFEKIEKQDARFTAHQWKKLTKISNRWAVFPNKPDKMFVFPSWSPAWSKTDGKLFLL